MYESTYLCIDVRMHVCICGMHVCNVCLHTYMYFCKYAVMHVAIIIICMHICEQICMLYECESACMFLFRHMHLCIFICMDVCTYQYLKACVYVGM